MHQVFHHARLWQRGRHRHRGSAGTQKVSLGRRATRSTQAWSSAGSTSGGSPSPGSPRPAGRVRDAPSQLLRLPQRPPSQQSRSFWRNCTRPWGLRGWGSCCCLSTAPWGPPPHAASAIQVNPRAYHRRRAEHSAGNTPAQSHSAAGRQRPGRGSTCQGLFLTGAPWPSGQKSSISMHKHPQDCRVFRTPGPAPRRATAPQAPPSSLISQCPLGAAPRR